MRQFTNIYTPNSPLCQQFPQIGSKLTTIPYLDNVADKEKKNTHAAPVISKQINAEI